MTARFRRIGLALSAAAFVLGAVFVAGSVDAVADVAASAVRTDDAAQTAFGSCVNGQHTADVVLLIDASGSLANTDPSAARVTAARYLASRLLSATEAGKINLSVTVAAFADSYRAERPWTRLTRFSLGQIDDSISGLKKRDDGFETDYWQALDGARQALAERQTSSNSHCQAILWFTDGELSISARKTAADRDDFGTTKPYYRGSVTSSRAAKAAKSAARRDICRAGGLADSLRSSNVRTFAVGLQAKRNQQDFGLLQSIATGRAADGQGCGAITSPSPGSFQLASDLDSLLFAFDAIGGAGQPVVKNVAGVCQRVACNDQHAFVLDVSIRGVDVLATSTVSRAVVQLRSPAGVVRTLTKSGRQQRSALGGTTATWQWVSEKSLEIRLRQPAGAAGWSGQWSLVFTDPTASSPNGVSRSNVHIESDITATWPLAAKTTLRSGSRIGNVRLGLGRVDGSTVDPSSLKGSIALSAELLDATGNRIATVANGLNSTTIAAPQTLDLRNTRPGRGVLRLTLTVTTAAARLPNGTTISGTTLSPQSTDIPLTFREPVDYPQLSQVLDFGDVTGAGQRTAYLDLTGRGCAWLLPGNVRLLATPADVGKIDLSSRAQGRASCVSVRTGAKAQVPVILNVRRAGDGALNGNVTLMLVSDQPDARAIPVVVPFRAELEHPLDTPLAVLAFVLALLLGIGIPLILVYVAKFFEARIPQGTLLGVRFPVVVTPEGVIRDGLPLTLRDRDFVDHLTVVPKGARSSRVAGTELRAVISRLPGQACDVAVEEPGRLSASSALTTPYDSAFRARLPLAVRDHWVVIVDPERPTDGVELFVVIGVDTPTERREALFDDAGRRAPGLVTSLTTSARQGGRAIAATASMTAAGGLPATDLGSREAADFPPPENFRPRDPGFPDAEPRDPGFPGPT